MRVYVPMLEESQYYIEPYGMQVSAMDKRLLERQQEASKEIDTPQEESPAYERNLDDEDPWQE